MGRWLSSGSPEPSLSYDRSSSLSAASLLASSLSAAASSLPTGLSSGVASRCGNGAAIGRSRSPPVEVLGLGRLGSGCAPDGSFSAAAASTSMALSCRSVSCLRFAGGCAAEQFLGGSALTFFLTGILTASARYLQARFSSRLATLELARCRDLQTLKEDGATKTWQRERVLLIVCASQGVLHSDSLASRRAPSGSRQSTFLRTHTTRSPTLLKGRPARCTSDDQCSKQKFYSRACNHLGHTFVNLSQERAAWSAKEGS